MRYCSNENFQKKVVKQAHDYAKSLERSPIDAQAYAREEVIRKSEVKAKTCSEKKEDGRSTIGDLFRVYKKKTFFLVACLTVFFARRRINIKNLFDLKKTLFSFSRRKN